MRIVMCDDEKKIGDILQKYLTEYFDRHDMPQPEYQYFEDGESLLEDQGEVDIAFLDVEMTGISGIHVGAQLKKKHSNVIIFIVTSYQEYLDDAMRFRVFRYLTKPVDKNRLFRNMNDAMRLFKTSTKKVAVESRDDMSIMDMSDIIFVEAKERKVLVYTKKSIILSVNNLQYWAEKLDPNMFFRVHRNCLVNLKYVTRCDKSSVFLCNGKYDVYLTMRKYKSFKEACLLFAESSR